jgi:dihydroneopterin aldolase
MDLVFDYDPLIAEIVRLAKDQHYETQERLMTRIVMACAGYDVIEGVEIMLRKTPVVGTTGHLGVRLSVGGPELRQMRA